MFIVSYIVIRLVLLINYGMVIYYANKPIHGASETFYLPRTMSRAGFSPSPPQNRAWRAITDPYMWKTSWPLMLANTVSVVLFGASAAVMEPLWTRSMVWLASILVDLAAHNYVTYGKKQLPFRGSHLPERMGLITMYVQHVSKRFLSAHVC